VVFPAALNPLTFTVATKRLVTDFPEKVSGELKNCRNYSDARSPTGNCKMLHEATRTQVA
jgi:hypothetical protein